MFSTLRTRFGIPGVISVIALVFAMLGGAYAANQSGGGKQATASAIAKKGPRGLRGPRGAQGPAGPQGAQGPAGAKGKDGANGLDGLEGESGLDGESGLNGKTVLNGTGAPDDSTGVNGDFYIDTAASEIYGPKAGGEWEAGTSLKGPAGPEGVCSSAGCTLPKGVTLKGTWAIGTNQAAVEKEPQFLSISFGIPTNAPVGGVFYMKKGQNEEGFPGTKKCKGGVSNPTVEPLSGTTVLCIFTVEELNWNVPNLLGGVTAANKFGSLEGPAKSTGVVIEGLAPNPGPVFAYGIWAVKTAP